MTPPAELANGGTKAAVFSLVLIWEMPCSEIAH
jgi:hypothetical protein